MKEKDLEQIIEELVVEASELENMTELLSIVF
jgi:hypothetical protein